MAAPRHPIVARFGKNLSRVRDRADITQEQVHWESGVHPTEISRMEGGERDVRISTVARLADALGVTPGELLDGPRR